MRNRKFQILFCLSAVFVLTACIAEEDFEEPQVLQRTLLFYMGGDNNLSGEVAYKIEQLQAVEPPPCTRVLVFKDTRSGSPQLLEWKMENGERRMMLVHDYQESNSASPEVFADVLCEVRENYPAPSFGLFVFSHASGWMPEGTYNNLALRSTPQLRSIITDGRSEMELTGFAGAIPDGIFDFIVFETCYMAGIEVAWEMKEKTKHIIASSAEIVSPGFSTCYDKALPLLYRNDLEGFCRAVEADYRTRPGDYGSLTLSLIRTEGLDGLAAALRGKKPQENGGAVQVFDRYGGSLFFDLEDSYKNVLTGQETVALRAAIAGCVIWKTATAAFMPNYGGFSITSHSGLTTYVPQEQYPKLNEAYKNLKWYKEVLDHER